MVDLPYKFGHIFKILICIRCFDKNKTLNTIYVYILFLVKIIIKVIKDHLHREQLWFLEYFTQPGQASRFSFVFVV